MVRNTVTPNVDEFSEDDDLPLNISQEFRLELVDRITKDAKAMVGADPQLMTKDEIRFLVSSYYGVQELRKLLNNRVGALSKQDDAASMFDFVA